MSGASSGTRGYFAVGIEGAKFEANVGSLLRTANLLGAAFVFTIGARYRHQASDTMRTTRHVPLLHFEDAQELRETIDPDVRLVGVELSPFARPLHRYVHPERAAYILGAEDHGISEPTILICDDLIDLPGEHSMNVAVAGSIAVYDRWAKQEARAA